LDVYSLKEDSFSGVSSLAIYGLGTPTIVQAEGVALQLGGLDSLASLTALISAVNRRGGEICVDLQDNVFLSKWMALRPVYGDLARSTRHCIAATDPLRLVLAGVLGDDVDIRVARNPFDPLEFKHVERKPDGSVRVGYGGSITHDGDLRDQAIGALLAAAELPNVELHFFGWHPQFVASRAPGVYPLNGRQYTYHGSYRDVVEYQASIGILDVAIAPLSDNDFNICKSSTKWVEHSCHETAMVVSDIPGGPYERLVDGVSGFRADSPEMFTRRVLELCSSPELRKRIGQNAREAVMGAYTTSHLSSEWKEALR